MGKIVIAGGSELQGELKIQGAKNTVLPILAASVLNGGKSVIHNCPDLKDVKSAIEILRFLGCSANFEDHIIEVDSGNMGNHYIPENLMREMRSSVMFLGAILGRKRKAVISYPGGCELGSRPIDLHIKALKQFGVKIDESHGYIYCEVEKLKGAQIHLDFPSVGATENIMLTAVFAEGETIAMNVAKEPEIVDLQNFLNKMGAKISGAGTDVLKIVGVKKLLDVEYTVIPDRIVASTYLLAGAITKGNVNITQIVPGHIRAVTSVLEETGCKMDIKEDSIYLEAKKGFCGVDLIRTQTYPGFPTDAQAPMLSFLTLAKGTSIIIENIFENRFKHTSELIKMGANINVDGRVAVVKGVPKLTGANVEAMDLRGGAALVLAGLAAEGITEVDGIYHIDRGYEKIEKAMMTLGADIKRVE